MSITINKRPICGGGVIFTSETSTTIREAIDEMRSALNAGESLNLRGAYLHDADLQGAYLQGADLHDAYLRGADLRGADLHDAYLHDAYLRGADLHGAYLRGADLHDADLRGAYLRGAYLQGADLRGADLHDADLQGAYLQGAYLQGADLGGGEAGQGLTPKALGLPEADPRFAISVIEAATAEPNALEMDSWHTCETTHCIAGWAVHLAGAAGKALEKVTSPSVAGAILAPSLAHLFYVGNAEALEALPGIKADLEAQCERGGVAQS